MSEVPLRYGPRRMARRLILALLSAACLAQPLFAGASALAAGTQTSESANPINDQGSSYEYRSNITAVTPSVPGLSFQVLEFADRILMTNRTGRTVTIYGYEGEPYARVLADGTVEQNVRSPATYLNTNFYAQVTVPPIASASAPPQWQVIDRTGQFEWHDHRIHWMSPIPPEKVKNTSRRTLIFDWRVPIAVGSTKGAIDGQLFWTPESSKAPLAVIVFGVLIALAGLAFVLFVRRRRARAATAPSGSSPGGADGSSEGAW
ncbi:MAG TPA: hypothetical protein VGX72_09035 [Solirubrobacteraceae bacterium]|nr:hypothetical protein [Solirubrobacteraceae bacterium]